MKTPSFSNNHLSPTALFVVLLAGKEAYSSNKAQQYLNYIDFTTIPEKLTEYTKICSFYDEIIKNRKHCIKKMAFDFLSVKNNTQIIILAAGIDPLSIEITANFPNAKIFDIDIDNMDIKTQILNDIKDFGSIKCITADFTKTKAFKEKLKIASWQETQPTLIIAEGISYYLSYENFWNVINVFNSPQLSNYLIMEYLVPFKNVSKKYRDIPYKTFKKLSIDYNIPNISIYTPDLLNKYIQTLNGNLELSYSLHDMEKQRCGKNKIFQTQEDSWITVNKIAI